MIFGKSKKKTPQRIEAERLDALGLEHFNAGRHAETEAAWLAAAAADPDWDEPPFSLGVLYKWTRRWRDCLESSQRALALNPKSAGARWNSGIAATALRDWPAARAAWKAYGIKLPADKGEIRGRFGTTPVRLDPQGSGEVVWGKRIDPARIIIESVPLPESGRRYGEIVLHDGEPKGERMLGDEAVPVFDEIELWQASRYITFRCRVHARTMDDYDSLVRSLLKAGCMFEDMSNVRMLCRQCSEGLPHEHHDHELPDSGWDSHRRMLIAARSPLRVRQVAYHWARRSGSREVLSLELALPKPKPARARMRGCA